MKHKLVYHSNFNYHRAEMDEWWTLWRLEPSWFGKQKWKPVLTDTLEVRWPVQGDRKWAKKIAKQFNIKVPDGGRNE